MSGSGSPVYVSLDTIQRPANGLVLNPAWGDQVNDNCAYLYAALGQTNTQVSTNTVNIATLTSTSNTHTTQISTLNGQVSTLNTTSTNHTNEINGIIGGTTTLAAVTTSGNVSGEGIFLANGGIVGTSDTGIYLQTAGVQSFKCFGNDIRFPDGIPTVSSGYGPPLYITNTGSNQVVLPASNAAMKKNIRSLADAGKAGSSNPVWRMTPREFEWKDNDAPAEVGFVVEELATVAPDIVYRHRPDSDTGFYHLHRMLAYVVEGLHELRKELDDTKGTSAAAA
jgi:hypothetical protein